MGMTREKRRRNIRWVLVAYDLLVYAAAAAILLALYEGSDKLSPAGVAQQAALSAACIFAARLAGNVYGQVWRYGGIQCYIRLLFTDFAAFLLYLCLEMSLPVEGVTFARKVSLVSVDLLGALAIRMLYRYAYKCGNRETPVGRLLLAALRLFSGIEAGGGEGAGKTRIAIIGAGRVGVSLAEELMSNDRSPYHPSCFIDVDEGKAGREIHGIPVWSEGEATFRRLAERGVREIVFAIPSMSAERKKELYELYREAGYKET